MNNFILCIKQEYTETPQNVFNKIININTAISPIIRIFGIWGWTGIASDITQLKDNISYVNNGLALCTFAIRIIGKDNNSKITKIDLELGTECLKSLADYKIDNDSSLDKNEKNRVKQWTKTFWDIWKNYMENELKKENRLTN
jgi:hypothetical protein